MSRLHSHSTTDTDAAAPSAAANLDLLGRRGRTSEAQPLDFIRSVLESSTEYSLIATDLDASLLELSRGGRAPIEEGLRGAGPEHAIDEQTESEAFIAKLARSLRSPADVEKTGGGR